MPCSKYLDALPEYVAAGEPDLSQYEGLRSHLAWCPCCQQDACTLRETEAALRAWPLYPVPPDLYARIMQAIDRRLTVEEWQPMPWNVWLPALSLSLAVLLACHLMPSAVFGLPLRQLVQENGEITVHLDPRLGQQAAWAIWTGVFAALAGIGLTLALTVGRMPSPQEMGEFRQRATHTVERILKTAGQ